MSSFVKQKGQTLLIVVLVMVVALTVGLSIASRTVINLKISKQNEESQRALQAAESGIEASLKKISAGQSDQTFNYNSDNNSSVTVTLTQAKANNLILNGNNAVNQDVGIDVWLSSYPNYSDPKTGSLKIYWGDKFQACDSGSSKMPALEIIVLSGNIQNPTINKHLFDPCGRINGTEKSEVVASQPFAGQNVNFSYATSDMQVANGLIMKVIPVYNSTKIAVVASLPAGQLLPAQGNNVESTGISGDSRRKINYFQSYPQIPAELFQYGILSQ